VPPESPARDGKEDAEATSDSEAKKDSEPSEKERPKLTPGDRVEATPASAAKTPPEAKTKSPAPQAETDTPAPPSAETEPKEPSTKFVRAMHAGACKAFGTVLGPAANAAHRDHFHFDMKQRRGAFCE
jgi:hypothetical protein